MTNNETRNRRFESQDPKRWLTYIGDFPLTTQYLAKKHFNSGWFILKCMHALLRAYGQILFANNPVSGSLICAGLFWADPQVALKGLFTGSIAVFASILFRLPPSAIGNGSTVFNSILVGLVSGSTLPYLYGIEFETQHWFYLAIAAVFAVLVNSALTTLLEHFTKCRLLAFALPFNIIQFMFLVCVIHMNKHESGLVDPTVVINNVPSHMTTPIMPSAILTQIAGDTELNGEEIPKGIEYMSLMKGSGVNQSVIESSGENITQRSFVLGNSTIELEVEETTIKSSEQNPEIIEYNSITPDSVNVSSFVNSYNDTDDNIDGANNETDNVPSRRRRNVIVEFDNDRDVLSNDTSENVRRHDVHVDWGQVFSGVICSMSQAFGLCHVPCSLLMYLAVVICSPITAGFLLVGSVLASCTGIVLGGAPYVAVYEGVWGFNGMLAAGALGGFCYVITLQSATLALLAAVFTTMLQNVLMIALEESNLPIISLPFNLSAILFLCVASSDEARLPRPDSLTFPEKHLYDYQQHQRLQKQLESPQPSSPRFETKPIAEMKRAPLAEQEVV